MKKVLFVGIPFIVIALVAAITMLYFNANKVAYNEHPDLSIKTVGSIKTSPLIDRIPIETIDQLTKGVQLIVIGTVLDDGTESSFNMFGNDEAAKAAKSKGINSGAACTLSKIKIEEVIVGEKPQSDTITLFQHGKPGVTDAQAKVKKSEKVLLMLTKFEEPDTYLATSLEDSEFYVDEKNTLRSMSDIKVCARYDGLAVDVLVNDLKGTKYIQELN